MIKKTALYGALILCILFLVTCTTDEESMIGPFGDASKYISATTFTAESDELFSEGDSTKITIVLLNVNNSPLEGLKVSFSTDLGKITESDITDSTGTAEAIYFSDDRTGEATIVASTGAKNYETTIKVTKYEPSTIELSAESLVLLADGNEYTKITAIPLDDNGNKMKNIAIEFNTDLGTLSLNAGSFGNTTVLPTNSGDSGEEAVVYLRSNTSGGTANIQALAGTTSSLSVYFYLEVPAFILLSADPNVILADGSTTSTITAQALDAQGSAMDEIVIEFDASYGQLSAPIAQTDADGIATVILTSTTEENTSIVIAKAGISDTTSVQFTHTIPHQIDISASEDRVMADGSTKTIITAIPRNDSGEPMLDIIVSFFKDTNYGTFSAFKDTSDSNGETQVELSSSQAGTITVTAKVSSVENSTQITFYEYNPAYIEVSSVDNSILADGYSTTEISATVFDANFEKIPGAIIEFSTDFGELSESTVIANQDGTAKVILTSEGLSVNENAIVTATVQGTSITKSTTIALRGIGLEMHIDSLKFSTGGYYNVYTRTVLIDKGEGSFLQNKTVSFSSTIGTMNPAEFFTNELGEASSIMKAEVIGNDRTGLIITAALGSSSAISDNTESLTIPGVETQVYTVDDDVMGDGRGFALMKATIKESSTNKAITDVTVDWATTHGTIKPTSISNTLGHTIDTLVIESAVTSDINVSVEASFGQNVSSSDVITFIEPENNNRLILGFEPDTTGHGIIPCDIDTSIATRDAGITAHFVDENGNGIDSEAITFSVVPNNLAAICETDTTEGNFNGKATVMMAYPPQNIGQIVRVWAEAPDGTRGNIDVVLPKHEEDEEGG